MRDLPARDLRPIKEVIDINTSKAPSNVVRSICPYTGILAHIALPTIKEVVFAYPHPLSEISNCRKLIQAGHKQLAGLDRSILAGMVLTCFKHYDLLAIRGTSIEANRILCLIPPHTLAKALHLVEFLNHTKAQVIPKLSLEWATYAEANMASFASNFSSWLKLLESELIDISELEELMIESSARGIPVYEIHSKMLHGQLAAAQRRNAAAKQARLQERLSLQNQKEVEAEFRRSKARAKLLVSGMISEGLVDGKFAVFLASLCNADNLKALADSTRDKVIAKLGTLQSEDARELVRILQTTANPFDLFDTTLDAPASEMAEQLEVLQPKRTLAQILAEKLAAKQGA